MDKGWKIYAYDCLGNVRPAVERPLTRDEAEARAERLNECMRHPEYDGVPMARIYYRAAPGE